MRKKVRRRGDSRISKDHLTDVWGEYGQKRIADLVAEHKHQCGQIEELLNSFRGCERFLTRDQLSDGLKIEYRAILPQLLSAWSYPFFSTGWEQRLCIHAAEVTSLQILQRLNCSGSNTAVHGYSPGATVRWSPWPRVRSWTSAHWGSRPKVKITKNNKCLHSHRNVL